jgi:hypothetical protein
MGDYNIIDILDRVNPSRSFASSFLVLFRIETSDVCLVDEKVVKNCIDIGSSLNAKQRSSKTTNLGGFTIEEDI